MDHNTVLIMYASIGLGVYLTMAIINHKSFRSATIGSIIRGLLGLLGWPVVLFYLYEDCKQ